MFGNLFSVEHSTMMMLTLENLELKIWKFGWMKWSVLVQKADWMNAHIHIMLTVIMTKMLV